MGTSVSTAEEMKRKKEKTEKVKRCQWPTKCVLEATSNIIDFGFNPPQVREYCKAHAWSYRKLERYVVEEPLKP